MNSSFYRHHRRETYTRWANATGRDFRFCVKIPKSISHEHALRGCRAELDTFVEGVRGLGEKLAVLLLQLPGRAAWEPQVAQRFFQLLQERIHVPVVCEPRHPSWSAPGAERTLSRLGISVVCADPPRLPHQWNLPGGVRYYRLHGSPRIYWSSYTDGELLELVSQIARDGANASQAWCIFDNTAGGAAWDNAEALNANLRSAAKQLRR